MKKTIFAVMLSTLALTACHDDDDNDSPSNGGNPPPSQLQGILTDGPISNVHYETSSGLTGETDEEGKFNYNEGDTIKFSIGNLQLGEADGIPAQARITPLDLYEDDTEGEEEALIVFLQSIDSDRLTPPSDAAEDFNPHENGIQINDNTIAQINTAFNETTNFEAALEASNGNVEELLHQIDPTIEAIDPEEAAANFQKAFYKEIAGTWQIGAADNSNKVILIVMADGSYKLGEADTPDVNDSGNPGYELGELNWSWKGGVITPEITIDNNGTWGLSEGEITEEGENTVSYTLAYNGTNLILKEIDSEEEQTHTFTRVENPTTGLVGTWELDGEYYLVLLNDNHYFLIDTWGRECADGIEYGTYTNTTSETVSFTALNSYDTNETCGLNNETANLSVNNSGDQLTVTVEGEENNPATFTRVTYGLP